MGMIRVVALQDHPYAQKPRKKGQVYEIDERFLKTLQVRGRVKVYRAEDSAPESTTESSPNAGPGYKRRDIRASEKTK